MEWLRAIDHNIFYLINSSLSHPFLDQLFPILTDLHKHGYYSVFAFVFLVSAWIYKRGREGLVGLLILVSTFAITDVVSHHVIKQAVQRQRPHNVLPDVQLRTNRHVGFSFPSNHAVNNFALATVLSYHFPKARTFLFIFAFLVAYSRVYVGVHFPADVFFGGVLGYSVGLLMIKANIKLERLLPDKKV